MANGFQGAPAVDFYMGLSGLGDTLQNNAKLQREQALRDAFKDGLPKSADGSIDFGATGNILSQHGADLPTLLTVAKLHQDQQKSRAELDASKAFMSSLPSVLGMNGGPQPSPANAPAVRTPQAAPATPLDRVPVASTPKVWGDKEAEDAGLYEPKPTAKSSFGNAFSVKPQPEPPIQTAQPITKPQPAAAPPQPAAQPTGFQGISMDHAPGLIGAMANPRLPAAQRELASSLLKRALDDAKEPDRIRFLQSLKERPDLLDIEKSLRPKTDVTTNIDQKGETEEAKSAGKAAGERRAGMFAAANSATNNLATLTRVGTLLDQVQQGKLEPGRMSVSAWAKSLGVNDDFAKGLGLDPKSVGTSQAVQAMTNELVLGKIGAGGLPANNFSDADRQFLTDTLPKLGNDPRANKILIEAARRVHQGSIQRALDYQAWKEDPTNRTRSFEDFELGRARQISQMDRFGDLRKQAETLVPSEGAAASGDANGISWRVK